ncbi:MAG: DUF86 domain-containing protein [Myxococcales bacterium]|nr:DUF86 domain-containing protein [Myxococcales bacterium]
MTDDRTLLLHIRDAIANIRSYTGAGREAFFAQRIIQDAVIRNLEIIGEATKGLSEALRASAPHIAWKRIAGMRDRLIHGYFGVSLELVWGMVDQELKPLLEAVEGLLPA